MPVLRYCFVLLIGLHFAGLQAQPLANTLLWEVSGPGIKGSSYLYGTVHLKDKRVFEFNDSLLPKLDKVDAFATELAMTEENILKVGQMMMLPQGQTLKDVYSPEDYKLVKDFVEREMGMNMDMIDRFKPMALMAFFVSPDMSSMHNSRLTVDEYLYQYAGDAGKELLSIETVEEQMSAFDKLDPQYIVDMIREPQEFNAMLEEMVEACRTQNLDTLFQLMEADTQFASMQKFMLYDRNLLMAERFMTMAKDKSVLFAIGAAHLPQDNGLIALLRNNGLEVTPIIAGHTAEDEDVPTTIDDDGFQITFPGKPEKNVQNLDGDSHSSQLVMYIYQREIDEATWMYSFAYTPLPSSSIQSAEMIDGVLEGTFNGVANQVNGEILNKQDLLVDGRPAKQADIKFGAGWVRSRSTLVDGTLVMMQVLSTTDTLSTELTDAYFNSLSIKNK